MTEQEFTSVPDGFEASCNECDQQVESLEIIKWTTDEPIPGVRDFARMTPHRRVLGVPCGHEVTLRRVLDL